MAETVAAEWLEAVEATVPGVEAMQTRRVVKVAAAAARSEAIICDGCQARSEAKSARAASLP